MTADIVAQRDSLARLRQMLRAPDADIAVFCSPDPVVFVAMSAWTEGDPAPPMAAANQHEAGSTAA